MASFPPKDKQRIMKKILLIAAILLILPFSGECRQKEKAVSSGKITSIITEFRGQEGVETVRLGRIGTAALKGAIRLSASDDPEAREILKSIGGMKSLVVFDFEDASSSVKERIISRLERALEGVELLMEVKDGSDTMQMYGVLSEDGEKISDFIMHSPSDCALICLFGSISTEILSLAEND